MVFNSELQFTAGEISEFCGEPKKLGKYLGVIKRLGRRMHTGCSGVCATCIRLGIRRAREIISEIRQRDAEFLYKPPAERPPAIKDRAGYFIWKAKNG